MVTVEAARPQRATERRFYLWITAAMGLTVLVGFARSFFLRPWFPEMRAHTPSESFFYWHGALFALWMALLAAQPALVAARRVDLHRRIGWFGAGLAAAMVGVGFQASLIAARRGFTDVPIPGAVFLAIPLFDLALFALFVALAIARRRDAQAHKRWMLLASINLLPAAIARIPHPLLAGSPIGFFGATDLFLVAILVWDLVSRRRPHPVTAIGGFLLVASQPLRLALSGTDAWARFAAWLL
jgi:hypothetical protein